MTFHYYWNGTPDLLGVLLFAAVYLAPAIVAILVRSRHAVIVALVDIFLGWTVIGWIVAWVICILGMRQQPATAPPAAAAYHVGSGLSPDGMYWWDGAAWRDTRTVAPPHAPRSPDGHWWWDGQRWRPVPPPPPA